MLIPFFMRKIMIFRAQEHTWLSATFRSLLLSAQDPSHGFQSAELIAKRQAASLPILPSFHIDRIAARKAKDLPRRV